MDDATRDEYQAEVRKLRAELQAARAGHGLHAVAEPPPLRQRDIIRALLDIQRERASRSSRATVRLTRNAKGDVQPEVLVEVSNEDASEAVAQAKADAVATFDALCLVYSLDETPTPRGAQTASKGDE